MTGQIMQESSSSIGSQYTQIIYTRDAHDAKMATAGRRTDLMGQAGNTPMNVCGLPLAGQLTVLRTGIELLKVR